MRLDARRGLNTADAACAAGGGSEPAARLAEAKRRGKGGKACWRSGGMAAAAPRRALAEAPVCGPGTLGGLIAPLK